MPKIDVSEEQILESLRQLSPNARQEALRRLIASSAFWDDVVERNRPRIEAVARARGLDWNSLTEDQRERLVDELLHER